MSKSQPLSYPNRIEDHHTVIALRELIDHANYLKSTVDQNATAAQKTADTLAKLPPPVSSNDVELMISTATAANGVVTQAINDAFKRAGIPLPPAPTAASAKPRSRVRVSGTRAQAPQDLGPNDAGLLYYCSDYEHLCVFDGWAWQIADPGGYLADSPIELGSGWALCDGRTTDVLLNDTPNLEVRGVTTPHHRSLRRGIRRYLRR